MLQPDAPSAECGHPRRNVPEKRNPHDHSHWKREAERSAGFQSMNDSPLLRGLKILHETRHRLATPLNVSEMVLLNVTRAQRLGQDIDGFHGIGNRAVYAHSTDRQHDVRGVAEEQ